MEKSGAKDLEEFRSLPPEELFRLWKSTKGSVMAATPVVDNLLIKKGAKPRKMPYMVGSTSHDMAPAILYKMTQKWAKINGAYMWMFSRMLPGDDKGAWHSSDLWYWFGTLENCWRPMTGRDYSISDAMATYLCSFVKNGTPDGERLPVWGKCTNGKTVMCFGDSMTYFGKVDMGKLIYNTLTTKPVGE